MAPRIIWSPIAERDINDIYTYIAHDSKKHAITFIYRLSTVINNLKDNPEIGRLIPKYKNMFLREKIWGKYRIIYKMSAEKIVIITIIHGARRLRIKSTDL